MSESTESRESFDNYEKPLLHEIEGLETPRAQAKRPSIQQWWTFGVAQLLLLAIYTAVFFNLEELRSCSNQFDQDVVYSPARAAVTPQAKTIHAGLKQKNPYLGAPTPEGDAAWKALFDYANIRVTQEELRPANRTSVLLNDDSGDAFGVLDVFHQLHCVKYIREYVHQDYYNLKATQVPPIEHVDHCIDMIRQLVQCKADISLMTFEWIDEMSMPWPNFELQHECRDWDSIVDWSKQRAIDINDFSLLVHPTLGPAFKEPEWNHTKTTQGGH